MGQETGHRMFRAKQTVRFEHRCADAEPRKVQAYAELKSDNGLARALLLVYVRRDPEQRRGIFVGARLVAMRFKAGDACTKWSVSLDAHSAGGRHVGAKHSHYISCRARGEGRRRPFRTDRNGVLDWLDHAESVNGKGTGGYPYNFSPKMETTAAALRMTDESRDVSLDLVLTESETGNTVRLRGPSIHIPDRIWNEPPSEPTVPGLFASFSLLGRDGLWRTLARAARHRECIRERRWAKRDFSAKWRASDV